MGGRLQGGACRARVWLPRPGGNTRLLDGERDQPRCGQGAALLGEDRRTPSIRSPEPSCGVDSWWVVPGLPSHPRACHGPGADTHPGPACWPAPMESSQPRIRRAPGGRRCRGCQASARSWCRRGTASVLPALLCSPLRGWGGCISEFSPQPKAGLPLIFRTVKTSVPRRIRELSK